VAYFDLVPKALRRDGKRCQACGTSARPVLAVHHIIPVTLGGRDVLRNLITLCANCHRIVHWLATGDRSLESNALGLAESLAQKRHLLTLARRIRRRRLRVVGPDLRLTTSIPLETAMNAVIRRNGLVDNEADFFTRCLKRGLRKIAASDRNKCSVRRVRESKFISVNANNHLVLRAPAWSDRGKRYEEDIILVWPHGVKPSILSPTDYRRAASGRFKLIPCINLYLRWEECMALSSDDWELFRKACHEAFTPPTRRRTSNVILE